MMDQFTDAFIEALYRKNDKLQEENKRLREALTKISEGDRFDLYQLMSNPAQNAEAYRLINIAKEALLNIRQVEGE